MRWKLTCLTITILAAATGAIHAGEKKERELPNILWITCEDMGPHLGCYGDMYSDSPNLDALARRSLRYLNVWSNAPVCAPARTTIITGMYPPATGAEHMRSQTRVPASLPLYPTLLRRLGYYCTNNVKEDYNLAAQKGLWNDSSNKAHWKNRTPGQPFFAVFNFTITHESQIRTRPHKLVHDPSKVRIPAYHPDTPEVRHDWAQYYDNITTMDRLVGKLLQELADDGLAEDTIVFFYADHGSGMPRCKRVPYDSGLHVPLLIHVPARFRELAPKDYAPGGTTDRLVSFVDLAPTLLSIAGEPAADYHQGFAFMGKHAADPPPYIYGFRGRMDERYDMVRSVRDGRYVYVRNYAPHKPYGQHLEYMFQTPTTKVWKQLFDAGKLNEAQSAFWKPRPPEELYDLHNDRDEVRNLADSAEHQDILKRLRQAQRDLVFRIRDVGFLPENEIHTRSQGATPYEVGHDPKRYPLDRIVGMAERATSLKRDVVPDLLTGLKDEDSAVRYWAALGLLMRGQEVVRQNSEQLREALADKADSVRVAATEALGTYGQPEDVKRVLPVLLKLGDPRKNDVHVCIMALNVLDGMGEKAAPALAAIRTWPTAVQRSSDPRSDYGVPRLIANIKERLE